MGLLVGLTGAGGGALMTPMIMLVFSFKPAAAISSAHVPSSGGGARQSAASIGRSPGGSGWRSRGILLCFPPVWNSVNPPVTRCPCSLTLTSSFAHFSVS